MRVYAVVVTHNGIKWIDKCLSSITGSSIAVEIILVDNLSSDHTLSYVKENFPQVYIIRSAENLGFGKANNIGIKYALSQGASYVFLLNQDAWVEEDTIERLIEIHKSNGAFGILSPIQLNGKGNAFDYNFSLNANVSDCPGFLSDLYLNQLKQVYPITFVMAALWLLSRDAIEKAGLFDPVFPHYGEDTDYVQRMTFFGYKTGICPGVKGFHDREERPPSDERYLKIKKLSYLCALKNNNKKFSSVFGRFIIGWMTDMSKAISRFRWKIFFSQLKAGFEMIFNIPQILTNRKYTRHEGAFLA